MKPKSISCLECAGNTPGWASPPISRLWSCQKEKKGWWGGGGSSAVQVMGGMRIQGALRSPRTPTPLAAQLSSSAGLLCSSTRKNLFREWPDPTRAVIYGHPFGAKNKHKMLVSRRSRPCKELLPSRSCCGHVPRLAALRPGAFRKKPQTLNQQKHELLPLLSEERLHLGRVGGI